MIETVVDSAILRNKKSVANVGDLVRLELDKNVWQVVAISGEHTKQRREKLVDCEPYRFIMVRKMFNSKGVFKPSPYAECVHSTWVNKLRKDKLDEFERYFDGNPEDRAVARDLSAVTPEVCGGVYCRANFKDADIKAVLSRLREETGYPVYAENLERVIAEWVKRGKVQIDRSNPLDEEIKRKYPYRIFVCGYNGYYDENLKEIYETVGIDLSAEEKNYWFNADNARKAIREVGRENNGTHYVFR